MSETETSDETMAQVTGAQAAGEATDAAAPAWPVEDAGSKPLAIPDVWPDAGLRPHRFAGIFRMLGEEEHRRLADDIAEQGMRNPIVVFEDAVLDGRNRYLALIDNGAFDPEEDDWEDWPDWFTAFDGDEAEALEFVWSLNEQRRHDSPTQRALSAARYANLRDVTLSEAARRMGVSERSVSSAQHVLEHGVPELERAMDDGRIPAYLAEQVADLDDEEQREVVAAEKPARAAREKLADPPPLATSGEVIKPTDPAMLAMFAAAVLEVGKAGKDVDLATLNALLREHRLAADGDETLNLTRQARLAFEVARKRLNLTADDELVGMSWHAVLAAGLSDDLDLLAADYRTALTRFDQALVRGEHERASEARLMMDAILWHANGKSRLGMQSEERPGAIVNSAALPPGVVPMWGQPGLFEIEAEGLPVLVDYEPNYWGAARARFFATRFDLAYPRGGWNEVQLDFRRVSGRLEDWARASWAKIVEDNRAGKKAYPDDSVGMFFPERIFRAGEGIDPPRIARGVELIAGQWPAAVAAREGEATAQVRSWRSGGAAPGGKKRWPKPVHIATHILSIGEATLVPVADFPENGAYLSENNGTWRYVDDGTDPAADAVDARLRGGGAMPDRAAYDAALAALTEPRGKLHQGTARDALAAGLACGVPVRQMAEDLGHKLGTVQSWTSRLGLTDASRNPVRGEAAE